MWYTTVLSGKSCPTGSARLTASLTLLRLRSLTIYIPLGLTKTFKLRSFGPIKPPLQQCRSRVVGIRSDRGVCRCNMRVPDMNVRSLPTDEKASRVAGACMWSSRHRPESQATKATCNAYAYYLNEGGPIREIVTNARKLETCDMTTSIWDVEPYGG